MRATLDARTRKGAGVLAGVLVCLTPLTARAQSGAYAYRQRGAGETLRNEGVKTEPYGGALTLLSFTVGRPGALRPSPSDGNLRVAFFASNPASARLTVRELHSVKSYLLEADRDWRAGPNEFAWPSGEVVEPVGVEVANLGVVISEKPGGSGTVYPARLGAANASGYSVVIRSKYTCEPLAASLFRGAGPPSAAVRRQSVKRAAARAVRTLEFDASGLTEGPYTLRVTCEREGHGEAAGPDSDQRVFYDFYHRPAFLAARVP